ncbi:hypothetical protein AaE_014110 [Aphanomyces astaci]|uniref:Uncharacterized protein n=1 Tax=Aphanomyces astaci TaxID=112090 RepID=A0A6A4ZFI1_APHAT|nr:hypothetical protein AaE_014110 [Aphanomyces astaci]
MASSLLVLLADVEASIQKVQGALHCEEDAYRHEIDMASILDGDEFELVQELADACLLAVGAGVDHVVIPEQAPVESTSLVDEIQELEILLGELLPKANPDENDDDVDGGSTASTVSSCSSISSSSATPEPDPTTPRQADMNSPNRKKRNRQAGSRRRHEHRAMWDCFERSCLQTHADRHRVARLYRHVGPSEAQVKVQKCVRARLQTASNRQAKPLELLPPPPRASQYLDKYHQTPLTTKRRTWARSTLPAPTGTPSTLNDPVSILVSVYLNDNRDTMTRLYAHSWGDLQAKARYKLQV